MNTVKIKKKNLLNPAISIVQCIDQPSSEKLLLSEDRGRNWTMCRQWETLEHLAITGMSLWSLSRLRHLYRRTGGKIVKASQQALWKKHLTVTTMLVHIWIHIDLTIHTGLHTFKPDTRKWVLRPTPHQEAACNWFPLGGGTNFPL